MGAYEQCLRDALHRRAYLFSMRMLRSAARRVAKLFGSDALVRARARALAQTIASNLASNAPPEAKAWVLHAPSFPPTTNAPPKVVQIIGSLAAGGAERQLALHTIESKRLGLASPTILTLNPCTGEDAHYAAMVNRVGIEVRHAGAHCSASVRRHIRQDAELHRRLCAIPVSLRPYTTDLAGEFLQLRPDVVHAWLDYANVCAAIAALAVGVPRVVLTFRSLNPTHFPGLCRPWMLPWYRIFAQDARVSFLANSTVGADDYAAWIGMDRARITVVRNGIDPALLDTTDTQRTSLRNSLCAESALLIAGVFRIGEEKQPLLFADVARRVVARVPEAVFVVAGDGAMRSELEHATRDLEKSFQLLGRRSDAPEILACADVALLTSRAEGTPNVLIEAQALGTPVVATAVGGIPDAVQDGVTGFLAPSGDAEALADAIVKLLRDTALRRRMAAAARTFARDTFSLERMTRTMAQSYE